MAAGRGAPAVVVSARIEAEIRCSPSGEEKTEFLGPLGLRRRAGPGIRAGYRVLDLITYFTVGPKESPGLDDPPGTLAPQAAGGHPHRLREGVHPGRDDRLRGLRRVRRQGRGQKGRPAAARREGVRRPRRGRAALPRRGLTRAAFGFHFISPSGGCVRNERNANRRLRPAGPAVRSSSPYNGRMADATLSPPTPVAASAPRRKVARRVLPLLFLLYVVAYLDRANVGFAKLQMKGELGVLRSRVRRGASGCSSSATSCSKSPGALLVERWSARKWFARILVTWGFCSMAMALVRTPGAVLPRALPAGAGRGRVLPRRDRLLHALVPRGTARAALAGMLLGVPVSLALGARVSGRAAGAELVRAGRLAVGVPGRRGAGRAAGRGGAVPADRPAAAGAMADARRTRVARSDAGGRAAARRPPPGPLTLRQALRQPTVWLLALGILATNTGGYAFVFWLPTAVQRAARRDRPRRRRRRRARLDRARLPVRAGWGVAVGLVVGPHRRPQVALRRRADSEPGCSWRSALVPGQPWAAVFVWLCLAGFFAQLLVRAVLGAADAGADAVGRGGRDRDHQHVREPGRAASARRSVGEMKDAGLGDRACLLIPGRVLRRSARRSCRWSACRAATPTVSDR